MTSQSPAMGEPNRPTGGRPGDPRMTLPEQGQMAMAGRREDAAADERFGIRGGVADAVPLGLAAFALATFMFSAFNAGWTSGTVAWLTFGIFAGGLVQLLAGMWSFRNRDLFGTVAFSMYGAFYLGLALYVILVAPGAGAAAQRNDLAWIFLAFALFNAYLTLWASQVNEALFLLFFFVGVTLVVLCVGFFIDNNQVVRIGGYFGVIAALVAWYASSAGLINGLLGRKVLKMGGPIHIDLERRSARRTPATTSQ
ncbi:acetate uptake transporter [Asanoa sp. NPDC050611]|uniref:acetate uptake transporter n=1 Tax=Asanoa sp. NPDC050611 TaxID=3157098 RepID=UPI00340A44AA